MNILGIKQIPGEYWTAASLAEKDQYGKTWMEYQGYTQRAITDLPRTGDLLVLDKGSEVITVQTWSGSEHLVPVSANSWTGHLGIVLGADPVEKEGTAYIQIRLLSANWGVNSRSIGVAGSCFNVDESTFLLPPGYKKAHFFFPTDPVKMRERMVNRAARWSMLGLPPDPQTSLDGFSITPSGFISYILEPVGEKPITPSITDIPRELVEIQPVGILPGDILVIGESGNPELGLVTAVEPEVSEEIGLNINIISMQPGEITTGPTSLNVIKVGEVWSAIDSEKHKVAARFFRYRQMPDYPALQGHLQVIPSAGENEVQIRMALTAGGIHDVVIHHPVVVTYPILPDGRVDANSGWNIAITDELTLIPGELESRTVDLQFPRNGDYLIGLQSDEKEGGFSLNQFERMTLTLE
ncbi:MAG: hypothetical protein GYA15_06055 [Leptolinea sp.]|nr:hypothetical protein [Leptolinea sp.]